jgi:hypothetical protein
MATDNWMASNALSTGYLPLSRPAISAISADISIRLKFFPLLKNSANFLANFSLPSWIGLGKTSARVITEEKAIIVKDLYTFHLF